MKAIEPDEIHRWVSYGGKPYPQSVGARCGHCGKRVRWTFSSPKDQLKFGGSPASFNCVECTGAVRFYAVRQPRSQADREWLYIDPHAPARELLDLSYTDLPEGLKAAYRECNEAFDHGLYVAATGQARRTLEGAVRELLAGVDGVPEQAMLGKLFEILAKEETKLVQPVRDAADAVKDGGNLGSHFNASEVPDETVAFAMLRLLDDLISYLFLVPARTAELRDHLPDPKRSPKK